MALFSPLDTEDVLRLVVTVFSFIVVIIAALSYRRQPTTRTLLLTCAFAIFAVKGVILGLDLFLNQRDLLDYAAVVADAGFIVLMTIAFLKG